MNWINAARWHPYVILLYLLGGMLVTMLTWNPVLIAVSFVSAAVSGSVLCGKKIWKPVLWFIPVILFAVGILPLFSHHGITPLFYVNGQPVTRESVCYGAVMSLMFLAVFLWFQIASRLLDGEKLMFLCRVFPSLGLLVSMVFRMLPLLQNRFREIREARRGLGMQDLTGVSLTKKCRQFGRELSILISWSLENAVETSVSMESRGYGTGRRTGFHLFRIRKGDVILAAALLLLYGIPLFMIGQGRFETFYFPAFRMEDMTGNVAGIAAFAAAALASVMGGRPCFE